MKKVYTLIKTHINWKLFCFDKIYFDDKTLFEFFQISYSYGMCRKTDEILRHFAIM